VDANPAVAAIEVPFFEETADNLFKSLPLVLLNLNNLQPVHLRTRLNPTLKQSSLSAFWLRILRVEVVVTVNWQAITFVGA
jgi:hypothetical protein